MARPRIDSGSLEKSHMYINQSNIVNTCRVLIGEKYIQGISLSHESETAHDENAYKSK